MLKSLNYKTMPSEMIQKHIPLPTCNSVYETDSEIVHIKKVSLNQNEVNIYYNKRSETLIVGRSKLGGTVPSIAHTWKNIDKISSKSRNCLQIGDSVVYLCNFQSQKVLCATIAGFREIEIKDGRKIIQVHLISNFKHCIPMLQKYWAPYQKEKFLFVHNNISTRKRAEKNIAFASYQDELVRIEEFYSLMRIPEFQLEITKRTNVVFNLNFLIKCHKQLFQGIYPWSGEVRKHEVVVAVGNKNNPTTHPDDLDEELKSLFKIIPKYLVKIKNNDKTSLITALIPIHKALADIHPFEDGNGRVIRLFLSLIAIKYGFKMDIMRNGERKYYHFAVRCTLKGYDHHLAKILSKWLNPLLTK